MKSSHCVRVCVSADRASALGRVGGSVCLRVRVAAMLPRRSFTAIVTVSAICSQVFAFVKWRGSPGFSFFFKVPNATGSVAPCMPTNVYFCKAVMTILLFFFNVTSKTICESLVISSCCLKCALSFLFSSYWLWCFCTVRVVLAAQKTLCLINCINTCSRLSNARVVTGVRFPVVSLQVGEKLSVLQPKPWIFTLIKSITF